MEIHEQQLTALAEGHRKRGALCVEVGEIDDAIEAYEQALEAEPDLHATQSLADLFARRARPGDAQQAADLYFAVGDVLGNPEGVPMLERALDQAPGHLEALVLLEGCIPRDQQAERLAARWAAFVAASSDKQAVTLRRQMLVRATAEQRGALAPRSGHTMVSYRLPADDARPREDSTLDGTKIPVASASVAPARSTFPTAATALRSSAPPPMASARSSIPPAQRTAPVQRTTSMQRTAPMQQTAPVQRTAPAPQVAPAPRVAGPEASSLPPVAIEIDVDPIELPKRGWALPDKRWLIGGALGSAILGAAIVVGTASHATPATQPALASASHPPAAVSGSLPVAVPVAAVPPPAPAAAPVPAPVLVEPQPSAAKKAVHASPSVRPMLKLASLSGGKLDSQLLAAALTKDDSKLERCYAKALKQKPHTEGRLTLAWTVRPNGRAAGVHEVSGTIKDPALYRCTAQVIVGTHFPKPVKRPAKVKLPLEYTRS